VRDLGSDELSQTMAAVANPVRRELLVRIHARPRRVTELAAGFDISLPAVSRHLKVLERARLVTRRIAGRDHLISPNAAGWDEMAAWVARRSSEWDQRLQALKRLIEAGNGDA
jgi:DNA-binding transcriptional ArsR family regulator